MRPDGSLPVKRAVARRLTDLSALQAAPPEAASGFKLRERAPAYASSPCCRRPLTTSGTHCCAALRYLLHCLRASSAACARQAPSARSHARTCPRSALWCWRGRCGPNPTALAVHLRAPASYLPQPLGPAVDPLCTCSAAHRYFKHLSSACSSKLSYHSCMCMHKPVPIVKAPEEPFRSPFMCPALHAGERAAHPIRSLDTARHGAGRL